MIAPRLVLKPSVMRVRALRWLRGSEAALILISLVAGVGAGLLTRAQGWIAHGLQSLIYGVGINRLSALASIQHPWKLAALPLGGLVLVGVRWLLPAPNPVDVVEANALQGGQVPWRDSVAVCLQTLVSNGFGASVGLEAAYTQAGGALASGLGRALGLKRDALRILVGAGAGAAIGAAFGAPLAGAFYGFEIVIGVYAPAAIAPVMAAALAARLTVRLLGGDAYLMSTGGPHIGAHDYPVYGALGVAMGMAGVALMRVQTACEGLLRRWRGALWLPVLGGLVLVPIAWASPQALSSGHGALRLELAMQPALSFLLVVFALKCLASIVSLSCGFRGGLFFASLFLGSLLGPALAQITNGALGWDLIDPQVAAIVGMAALGVAVVGAPMCLSLLVLESTHDFALTGVAIMAVLCSSAFVRATFGYSFSTWRLHLRGSAVHSARDQGWMREITARQLMRRMAPGAHAPLVSETLPADASMADVLDRFETLDAEEMLVADAGGRVLGVITEGDLRRRHAVELQRQQAQLFGERGR